MKRPGRADRCSPAAASGHDTPDHMIDATAQESELIHLPAQLLQSHMVLPLQETAAAFFKVFPGNFHLVCELKN